MVSLPVCGFELTGVRGTTCGSRSHVWLRKLAETVGFSKRLESIAYAFNETPNTEVLTGSYVLSQLDTSHRGNMHKPQLT
jgi:hypothetical protein